MSFDSKYKGAEAEALLDKVNEDYEVKSYADYADYYADTSRVNKTISFVGQDNSVWVRGKQYSMNAGCYVGSDKAGVSTTAWYLAGTLNVAAIGWDIQCLGYCTNSLLSEGGGLFVLNLRFNSATDIQIKKFAWLVKTGSTPNLRLVVSEGKVRLYVFVAGGRYRGANIRILTESTSTTRANTFGARNFFGLSDNSTLETTEPVGTDIADVPYITKTDANNKFLPILATTSLVKNNPNVGYVKFAEIDTKGQYGNKAITLSVSSAYASGSIWNDGLYMINIRGNGASTPTCRAYCFVDYRSGASKIKLYFASSGSKFEFYREVRTAQELTQLGFKVLNVENFESGKNWDFKLIESNKTTSDATFDTPIGTLTEIPNRGQVYFADNANSATKTTQDGNGVVIAGNYQRVYKSTFKVTTEGWYKLAYKYNYESGIAWKDRYIVVSVENSQGGSTSASFKILYNSQGGWLVNLNNDFMCMPLTGTNYACVTDVRLLSNTSAVSGKTYIEVYLRLADTTTELSVNMESNIPDTYLYKEATVGESDTSAYTVITRNAATSAYGGSLVVGGLIAEKALSANKVKQIPTTANTKRRVLLGGDNDNEEYESTYKSRLLTYNPPTGEFEITDTSSSFILSPTSPWFKVPTALWDRGFWLKYGDTSLGRLIGAKGEVSDIEYYYIGGTFTNPDFKFNPDTKTMEGNVLGNLQATSGNEVFIGNQGGAGASTNDTVWINYRDAVGSQTMNDSTPLAHYYFGNRKGGHSGVYLHAARFKGIADTADKLQTARKIGFANFDGSANVSLNTMQGAFNARWTNDTTQWLRIIRFKTKTIYTRKQLILAVYDTEGSSFSGIIEVTLTVSAQLTTTYAFVNWLSLWAAPNYNYKGMFKITATYPTDNDEYVYLDVYANSPYTYKTINFCVLSCNDSYELTIGNSGERVEGSALQNVVHQSTTDTSLVPKQSPFATDSAFLQSLEGLCHKSQDSSLDLRRRIEYICGQQVLSDTEEAGKAFYGSSANPLVISVPLKDPGDAVVGGKVNVNLIRYYYAENYWHEVSYGVNTSYTYTRWVANGTAWPWHRIMKEGVNIEYDAWVTKATNATNADVANKTKYPIVFKRNGASITNWFADTTFSIDIPEELLGYSAPTGIALKVPEISVANEAKKLSNDLEIKVNGVQQVSFDGSSAKTINIRANKTHFVKAANYGNGWTTPTAGATTPGIPLVLDTSFMIPLGQLMDGDTIIMQVPNTLTSTSTYPVYLQLDATEGIVTGNIVKIIKAQNAGTPVEWKGTTALTAGYYHFVYSEGAGGLIFMYRNVATS